MTCPLCLEKKAELFDQDKYRKYWKCHGCDLIFVARDQLLSDLDEKKRYDSHQNSESDPGYRAYLTKLASLAEPFLNKGESGLDYGCGRTVLLEEILKERGFEVSSFDLYYYPASELLSKKYDFIILSEVIEHLRDPRETMIFLRGLLNPGGRFLVKTKPAPEGVGEFSNWFYKRDLTHVQFFNKNSFDELASLCQLQSPHFLGEDLFLFKE